jgi:probable HAF family extracellular repeat protein
MQGLGILPGRQFSDAVDGSSNGTVVVGSSSNSPGTPTEAFRWTLAGGMAGLGLLPGTMSSAASAVSDDGSLVFGTAGGAPGVSSTFVWDAVHGMRDLNSSSEYRKCFTPRP